MINEDDKPSLDELLSDYLDGQLSERRHNEIKRMVGHDPELAARLDTLARQRDLLQAMPVEKAPSGLAQDILACLERRFLLEQYPKITRTSAGAKQLFARRVVTAAAILLPIGVLALVLWQILGPFPLPDGWFGGARNGGQGLVLDAPVGSDPLPVPTVPYARFSAVLELQTDQTRAVRSHLEKVIFTNGLQELCPPPRHEGATWTYVIRGPSARVGALLDDLRDAWSLCGGAGLTLHGPEVTQAVRIDRVTIGQIQSLLAQPSDLQRLWTAERFARLNAVRPVFPPVDGGVEPVKPVLAGGHEIRDPGAEDHVDASLVVLLKRP